MKREGNVIHADFGRPRPAILEVSIKVDLLYCDHLVCLSRITCTSASGEEYVQHHLMNNSV